MISAAAVIKPAGVDAILTRSGERFHGSRLMVSSGETRDLDVAGPCADLIQGDGFAADCVGILGTGVTFSYF